MASLSFVTPLGTVASANAATVSFKVVESGLQVNVVSTLVQNFTTMPEKRIELSGESRQKIELELDKSFSEKSRANVQDLVFRVTASGDNLSLSFNFVPGGAARLVREALYIDLSWRGFRVAEDLRVENITINRVGSMYLRPRMEELAKMPGTQFNLNKTVIVSESKALNTAGNATLLDFRALEQPFSRWDRSYSPDSHTTVFRLDAGPRLELTARTIEEGKTIFRTALIELSSEVVVPGFVRVQGDQLVLDVGKGWYEALMIVLTFSPIVIAVAIHFKGRPTPPEKRRETRSRGAGP